MAIDKKKSVHNQPSFRGSFDTIYSRMCVYQPLIESIFTHQDCKAIDLGCGRGEWLTLLTENGINCSGVDLRLEDYPEHLNISQGDATTYLDSLPTNSITLISAFHLVEHLNPTERLRLFSRAIETLKDTGIILLELPNPENLRVTTNRFFLDPTHKQILPYELLTEELKMAGFKRVEVFEPNTMLKNNALEDQRPSISSIIDASNPDITLIGYKNTANPKVDISKLGRTPVTLEEILRLYDSKLEAFANKLISERLKEYHASRLSTKILRWLKKIK